METWRVAPVPDYLASESERRVEHSAQPWPLLALWTLDIIFPLVTAPAMVRAWRGAEGWELVLLLFELSST